MNEDNPPLKKSTTANLSKVLSCKEKFIERFGIKMSLPANYILSSRFWKKDPNFIFIALKQSFPENLSFYDLTTLNNNSIVLEEDYKKKQLEESESVQFKLFRSEQGSKYNQVSQRQADPRQYHKYAATFVSKTGERIGLVRSWKSSAKLDHHLQFEETNEIDIFDSSSESFFEQDAYISRADDSFLATICDPEITKLLQLKSYKMKFSDSTNHVILSKDYTGFKVYDLSHVSEMEEKKITEPAFDSFVPSEFQHILDIKINKDDFLQSMVAFKRNQSFYIDVVTFSWLKEYNTLCEAHKTSKLTKLQIDKLNEENGAKSMILPHLSFKNHITEFSDDMQYLIHTSNNSTTLLSLGGEKSISKQKVLQSVQDKQPQFIKEIDYVVKEVMYKHFFSKVQKTIREESQFQPLESTKQLQQKLEPNYLIATADEISSTICLRITSDSNLKMELQTSFVQGSTKIMDILCEGGNNFQVLMNHDNESLSVFKIKGFNEEYEVQTINLCSLYTFEWPYMSYLKGNDEIIVQNVDSPHKAFFLKIKDLGSDKFVSHLLLTKDRKLFYCINGPTEHYIYCQNLQCAFPLLIRIRDESEETLIQGKNQQKDIEQEQRDAILSPKSKEELNWPLYIIPKSVIGKQAIYKFIIRDMSAKDTHLNEERLIFFRSKGQLYQLNNKSEIKKVDSCSRLRELNYNSSFYLVSKQDQKRTNIIKAILFTYSDYQIKDIHEEIDCEIEDFQIGAKQLILLIKGQKIDAKARYFKILSLNQHLKTSFLCTIQIQDKALIGSFLNSSSYSRSMVFCQNTAYLIASKVEPPKIHKYDSVIPLKKGETLTASSPITNVSYRKMIFSKVNAEAFSPKECIVLPYLTDNHITFNTNYMDTQFNNFFTYESGGEVKSCILTTYPQVQKALLYSENGQLLEKVNLQESYKALEEDILCFSQNCEKFVHFSNKDHEFKILSLFEVTFATKQQEFKDNNEINDSSEDEQQTIPYIHVPKKQFINLKEITVVEEGKTKENAYSMVEFYKNQKCSIKVDMNENLDFGIAFLPPAPKHSPQDQHLFFRNLMFIKNYRVCQQAFFVMIENEDEDNRLRGCFDFLVLEDLLIVYSQYNIYYAYTDQVNSLTGIIKLKRFDFQIPSKTLSEYNAEIMQISSMGAQTLDNGAEKLYIMIKVRIDQRATFMRYNFVKAKEYSTHECSLQAQCIFDEKKNMYILDKNTIICCQTGQYLSYYQVGLQSMDYCHNLQEQNFEGGSRFSKDIYCFNKDTMRKELMTKYENKMFMIRNRCYLPYSYYTLMLQEHDQDTEINENNYDPVAIFNYNGDTPLHTFAQDYTKLNFILEYYQKTDLRLMSMLLMKNNLGETVLQIAINNQNTKCVNLILDKLALFSIDSIHSVKASVNGDFKKLLSYAGFERYMSLCYHQTKQMKITKAMKVPNLPEDYPVHIHQVKTSYLDSSFYEILNTYSQDKTNALRSVSIKAIDAWVVDSSEGTEFLLALSECKNVKYFEIPIIRILITFLWRQMRRKIITHLFVPFLINFVLFNFYVLYTFEYMHLSLFHKEYENYQAFVYSVVLIALTRLNYIILIIFSGYVLYIEVRQMIGRGYWYFLNIWNVLDLSTALLPIVIIILDYVDFEDITTEFIRPISAVCTLMFYFKLFYFLRIFDSSAHYVRIIIEITLDVKIFIFVLFIAISGFGASFYILSMNIENEDGQVVSNWRDALIYAYLLSIGDFATDSYGNYDNNQGLFWILFIMASLFTLIILLNMLITIMGESYSRVIEDEVNQKFRDRLYLILENDFLINDMEIRFKGIKYLIAIDADNQEQICDQDKTRELQQISRDGKIMSALDTLGKTQEYLVKNLFKIRKDLDIVKKKLDEEKEERLLTSKNDSFQ